MTRPTGSESEFRRLREMTARTVRGPGPKPSQQRPPAGQGVKAEDPRPRPKAPPPAASSARPDLSNALEGTQPARPVDQAQA